MMEGPTGPRLDPVGGASRASQSEPGEPVRSTTPVRQVMTHAAREVPAGEKFEGFVLRSFVETMLPKENDTFFGKGTAGDVWRSKLAEHIGAELARGGGIGIADALGLEAASGSPDTLISTKAKPPPGEMKAPPQGEIGE